PRRPPVKPQWWSEARQNLEEDRHRQVILGYQRWTLISMQDIASWCCDGCGRACLAIYIVGNGIIAFSLQSLKRSEILNM
ncbi:hypothetical protein MUK42_26297, partial [Musa troglodytarum]